MKNSFTGFMKENKVSIIFTFLILVIVSIGYFTIDKENVSIYSNLKIKAELENGKVGLIVNAKINDISKYPSYKGE
jgi:hypothetical protein